MAHDVLITGIGLASSLGEGVEPHAQALAAGTAPIVDAASFAPYPVHPLKPLELDKQIPKKSDQRQMEPWQRLGVYTAGLALDSAGLKDDAQVKSELQVIVAAGGGERDHAVDSAILTGLRGERIHRSNLVGMGVVPFTLAEGTSWASLDLKGDETVTIKGLATVKPRQMLEAEITSADGKVKKVPILCRIDTLDELDYFKNAGILHYVLRGIAA